VNENNEVNGDRNLKIPLNDQID